MKYILCMAALFAGFLAGAAGPTQTPTQPEKTMRLWDGDAPFAKGTQQQDIPTLQAYFPANAKKPMPAILICPGGAYGGLSTGTEGYDYAQFLNRQGIAGFVLRYRLGSTGYRHPVMLTDASRALRIIRANAAKWNIDPDKVGVIGSSAGGHLAATLLTKFDHGDPQATDAIERVSSRPDFGILCYPVISMQKDITHWGSRINLLGRDADLKLVNELSAEQNIRPDTPPCFLWHTSEDHAVSPRNSIRFASGLAEKGIPYDLHIYQKGGHGMGLGSKFPYTDAHPWTRDVVFWLKANRIID